MVSWQKIIKIFWFLYLIFTILISLWSFNEYRKIFPVLTPVDWVHLITLPLWTFILIAYVWKKEIISVRWWKLIFYFTAADTVLSFFAIFKEFSAFRFMNIIYDSNLPSSTNDIFFHKDGLLSLIGNIFLIYLIIQMMLLALPGFYASYKLAFPKGFRKN